MKAMVCTQYGSPDVLELREVAKPAPKAKELLVRIHAAAVTSGDIRVRTFNSPLLMWIPMRLVLGLTRPRNPILGVELAGVVEAVGKEVTRFKPGDRVFALTGMRFGGYAEYTCLREDSRVALQPDNVTHEDAAAILFGGTTALHFFRKGNLRGGHKVLIYGASGAVGTSAVQLAKHFGAEVTAVCSAAGAELVKSLGAERWIDYTREDFTERPERYDIIFDAVGKLPKSKSLRALAPGGSYLTVDGQGIAKERQEDVLLLKELTEQGRIRAVIDRRYTLKDIPEAHRYVESGRKKGNVIVTI
ncbi:NAD(P)-dependent alcohol dehydrogenase [Paenibacillus caseinilyticus]|uniref:NADPH:quinone reductase n=1 Tax=Paenibacillus mucilaginosus K02 TaxID=997761 RepID=I0BEC5_9BACL|nr:NAD(P)-dependent alcohol dehydrogenase [Paenibacillus mucilaginosus]AFH60722.1 NADPH:quinone reductase [Paenibacillus mucilaginosus K02]